MDSPVWIPCAECEFGDEDLAGMVQHILVAHPEYSHEQAMQYAQIWQDDALEQQELEDIERAEEFRRTGRDPYGDWDDGQPGK